MSKSLESFTAWASAMHVVSNPVVNTYPGQCVSLVQQYLYQVFDIPYAPRGNAKDFIPPTFNRVTGGYRAGDIIRYGANYGGGYGHIGLIDENGQWIDQNGVVRLAVGRRSTPLSGWESVWRPTKPFAVKNPIGGIALVRKATANVRTAPNSTSQVTSTLTLGQTFAYDYKVTGESISGNNIWYHSKLGHYVWSGGITG